MTTARLGGVAAAASTVFLVLALGACGGADTPSATDTPPPPATSAVSPTASPAAQTPAPVATVRVPPVRGPHNEIDSMFSNDMIQHHRQAIEMAQWAKTRADDERITKIAARIEKSQTAEVNIMISWLKAWGEAVPAPDMMHASHGAGMMTHAEMEDLKAADGADFDRLFADMMIRHHQGGLQMAEVTKSNGQNASVIALATNVFATQTAEVTELTEILDSL